MDKMDKLRDLVMKGIGEVTVHETLDKETLCLAGELVDVLKDITTIEAMEEAGYSEMSYDDGMSYARRGRDGDGDGRYSERRYYSRRSYGGNPYHGRSYGDNSYNGSYGYERGYSRNDSKHQMIEHLENAMSAASSEQDRESIRRMIVQVENS